MTTVFSHTSSHHAGNRETEKFSPMKPLSAFAARPGNIKFETQESGETIELFLRQHPIVNLPWIIVAALFFIAPTVIFPALLNAIPIAFPAGYILIATAFWYLATTGFILTNFLHWFFNIYIVTNERIVDIDFKFLLYKHFSQAELTKIQDISFTASGIGATLFNYGNVIIETAGVLPTLEFEMVPHPQKVVEIIRTLADKQ